MGALTMAPPSGLEPLPSTPSYPRDAPLEGAAWKRVGRVLLDGAGPRIDHVAALAGVQGIHVASPESGRVFGRHLAERQLHALADLLPQSDRLAGGGRRVHRDRAPSPAW